MKIYFARSSNGSPKLRLLLLYNGEINDECRKRYLQVDGSTRVVIIADPRTEIDVPNAFCKEGFAVIKAEVVVSQLKHFQQQYKEQGEQIHYAAYSFLRDLWEKIERCKKENCTLLDNVD
jgi:hypothetical protein